MGIGCSCARDKQFSDINDLPQGTCIIALAKSIRGKKVVENIPTYFPILEGGGSETCSDYCRTIQLPAFFSSYCDDRDQHGQPVHEILDQNNWCKQCDEITTHCSSCEKLEDVNHIVD